MSYAPDWLVFYKHPLIFNYAKHDPLVFIVVLDLTFLQSWSK